MIKLGIAITSSVVALVLPSLATGATTYWGFNYLSPSNPAAGAACGWITAYAGLACHGAQGDTTSEVQNNSGGEIEIGFIDSGGSLATDAQSGTGTYDRYTSSGGWGVGPFSAACFHGGGTNYVQCRYA